MTLTTTDFSIRPSGADANGLTVGIIVAMTHEFSATVAELLPGASLQTIDCSQVAIGEVAEARCVIFQAGIGTTNAAAGAADLIAQYQPHCLLNLGTTALIRDHDSSLEVGDVLAGALHQQWDLDLGGPITPEWTAKRSFVDVLQTNVLRPDERLWRLLQDMAEQVTPAIQFTGNSFFCTPEQHQLLPAESLPVAVDMESFAVGQVAARKRIAWLSLRGITDNGRASANDDFYANVRVASRNAARAARSLIEKLAAASRNAWHH